MNVIWHNHIATYSDVEIVLGALGKKNERSEPHRLLKIAAVRACRR
jgi:hypothetical protein